MRIAIYGAGGYQAGLVHTELDRRGVETVLVGRAAGQRRATVDDHDALVRAFDDCAAVINCVGPFTGTGHAVIRAAVAAGCHYVDTAGEQAYVASVFDTVTAEDVTVVPAANDGCVPVDLLAHLMGSFDTLTVSHVITGGGGPSRGSLRSALRTLDAFRTGGLVYDDGAWHAGTPRRTTLALPDGPLAMARLPLVEVVTIPRHTDVRHVEAYGEAAMVDRLATPIPQEVIATLPVGPAEQDRRAQRFTYVLDTGDGRRGVIRGTDTYGTTAVIAAEAACRLATGTARPGVLAPAQAFDPRDFLAALPLTCHLP